MTEVLQGRPEINWARMVIDPVIGDPISGGFGVTRIRIGNRIYSARFSDLERDIQEQEQVGSFEHGDSRLYVGHADWGRNYLKVEFKMEKPVALADVDRINAAAGLAVELFKTETAWRASSEVGITAHRFVSTVKGLVPDEEVDVFGHIAVALDKVEEYANKDFPAEFRKIAVKMEEFGIAMISPGVVGQTHLDFWSPDYIWKKFSSGPDEKIRRMPE